MSRRRRDPIRPLTLEPDSPEWPEGIGRLGSEAPPRLFIYGNADLLRRPLIGIFCSQRAPGRAVVEALEVAEVLARAGVDVVSGFQSPVERELLATFLRGNGGVIVCPARALQGAVLRSAWVEPLQTGRMLLLSMVGRDLRRPTAALAMRRNRFVAALCQRVFLLHAAPGGQLWRLAREVAEWGLPLECLQHPANGDLQLLGAAPVRLPKLATSDLESDFACIAAEGTTGHGPCLR